MRAAAQLESAEHLHHLCAVEAGRNQPFAQSARTGAANGSVQRAVQRTAAAVVATAMEKTCAAITAITVQASTDVNDNPGASLRSLERQLLIS